LHRFSTGGAPPSRELGSGARVKNASATKCDAGPKPITAFRARRPGAAEGLEGRRVHPQSAPVPASSAECLVRLRERSLGTEATRTSTSLAVLLLPTARRGPRTRRSARSNRPRARPAPARRTGRPWPLRPVRSSFSVRERRTRDVPDVVLPAEDAFVRQGMDPDEELEASLLSSISLR
jgi:hypothetical protein